jgi:hypothetical protein
MNDSLVGLRYDVRVTRLRQPTPRAAGRAALVGAVFGLWLIAQAGTSAQAPHAHVAPADSPAWTWSWDAKAFLGWNYQRRKFRDFQKVESQNWLMGMGERSLWSGRLSLHTMLSFEPFTIQPLGSPEVFQTGETYQGAPLIDYQHPHDLFMDLGGTWSRGGPRGRLFVLAAPVGAPALGPPAFMHRPSAAENPTAPLGHHQEDATHISHGVLTGGIERGAVTFEGSWFRGAEPDENRKDIELGRLDSYSGRVTWRRDGWEAQASAGHLTTPEAVEPFSDGTRLTGSIGYVRPDGRVAALVLWGQNREIHGIMDAYLFEATLRPRPRHAWYTRVELATKDLLSPSGPHPRGVTHFHPLSRVGALTGGYVFDLLHARAGQFGIGGDATVYHVPPNLLDNYGSPASFHVFFRYRPQSSAAHSMHDMHDRE